MTVVHVRLGDDEARLLGDLAAANPRPLMVAGCDPIALGNLRAIGFANVGGPRVWISAEGLEAWKGRTRA